MVQRVNATPIFEAAGQWRDRCLLGERSVFTEKRLWVLDNVAQLDRHFVQNLDMGKGSFFEKLRDQLAPSAPEAKQLAAEMFWVLYLPVTTSALRVETKRHQIKRVWEWSGEPLPQTPLMRREVLEGGIVNPGTGYNTHRWRELLFFVVLLGHWLRLPLSRREELLGDPWRFIEWVDGIEESSGRQFRHILGFLLFPDSFERMATGYQKRKLVRRFREELEDPEDIDYGDRALLDREILRIRRIYEEKFPDGDLNFYRPPLREIWWDEPEPDDDPDGPDFETWYKEQFGKHRVWLIGTGAGGRAWEQFQRDGSIGIGWDDLGDLGEYSSEEEILQELRKQPASGEDPVAAARVCWQFAHEMRSGDFALARKGLGELAGWGRVVSDYEFDETRGEFQHRRSVDWKKVGSWAVTANESVGGNVLIDLSDQKEWLWKAFQAMKEPKPNGPVVEDERYTFDEAVAGLFMAPQDFQQILDALGRKQNLILEGPPGVGKSFIARRVAWSFMGRRDHDRVQMIQFHQSYTYEDFIQGWRPAPGGGFELRDGVFYSFCRRAAADETSPYVFIIDEINRGNLSKIFGEVMLLLEADKRGPEFAIPLAYSGDEDDPFYIPRNVHVLGLMNTADRSLAMVDYALRRRFAFVRLEPAFGSERFADYLLQRGVEEQLVTRIAERFSDLNDAIRDDVKNLGPGFELGHSYFCPQEGDERLDRSWYETVVRSEIEPLLHEYWFDDRAEANRLVERLLA